MTVQRRLAELHSGVFFLLVGRPVSEVNTCTVISYTMEADNLQLCPITVAQQQFDKVGDHWERILYWPTVLPMGDNIDGTLDHSG